MITREESVDNIACVQSEKQRKSSRRKNAGSRPTAGHGRNARPGGRGPAPTGPDRVVRVRSENSDRTSGEAFVGYLEELRDRAGIWSNIELAEYVREVGSPRFNASIISKWKTGATDPGIESLRAIAKVLGVDPIHLFLRAGLVTREDLGQRDVDPVYEDLVQLDHDMEDHELPQVRSELQRLRAHIEILVATTRGTVAQIMEDAGRRGRPVRRRRKAS